MDNNSKRFTKLALMIVLSCILSSCSPLDVVKAILPSHQSPAIAVDTHVGDNTAVVGQAQQIKSNTGVAVGHDAYSASTQVINQQDPTSKTIILMLIAAFFGFLVGWPVSSTPQKWFAHFFIKKKHTDKPIDKNNTVS